MYLSFLPFKHVEVLERQKVYLDSKGRASLRTEAIFALKEVPLLSQRLEPLNLTAYVPRLPMPPPENNQLYDMVPLMPCHKDDAKDLQVPLFPCHLLGAHHFFVTLSLPPPKSPEVLSFGVA